MNQIDNVKTAIDNDASIYSKIDIGCPPTRQKPSRKFSRLLAFFGLALKDFSGSLGIPRIERSLNRAISTDVAVRVPLYLRYRFIYFDLSLIDWIGLRPGVKELDLLSTNLKAVAITHIEIDACDISLTVVRRLSTPGRKIYFKIASPIGARLP